MRKYDVIVVGGGFAGVGAALAAAREGASVLLVEKGNCLGGAAVHALVNPFMLNNTTINGIRTPLSRGIFKTICEKLKERNATGPKNAMCFLEEELKYILNHMVLEANVSLLFHAYICDVKKDGEKINRVSVATRSGIIELQADYFIDATGDAQVAYLAGCPTVLGREGDHLCQPMTLCFRIGNVDAERFFAKENEMIAEYKKALAEGKLINTKENIMAFKNPIPNVIHINTTRVVKLDPTNPEDITKAELLAREQVFELYEFMKKHGDGLENSFLMMTAAEIGVRESRMIVGDYVLTGDDCKACTIFDDAICACNYEIDIHNPEGSGTSHYYFPDGKWYTVPYRSLIPKKTDNLLVAGRCISSDHSAQASYRVMSTVCCIGEGAGTAAGIAVADKCHVREVDIKKLQDTLTNHGAFVGDPEELYGGAYEK